jgi:hypothetical protein
MRAVLALLMMTAPAIAQQQCAGAPDVLEHLSSTYGESIDGMGNGPSGVRFATLKNPETGTFTFLVILPDGRACIIAYGEGCVTSPPYYGLERLRGGRSDRPRGHA